VVCLPLTVAGTLGDLGECEPVRAVALESTRQAREAVRVVVFMIAVGEWVSDDDGMQMQVS
jgi:hypothetical protein